MPFKMHKNIFFSKKKKICVPGTYHFQARYPKTLIFLFGLMKHCAKYEQFNTLHQRKKEEFALGVVSKILSIFDLDL